MLYLFYAIIFTELLTIFYNIIKLFLYKIKYHQKSNHSDRKSNGDFHINILIPCYKEINVINKTLQHFKEIITGIENIDIYIITTAREKIENTSVQSTYEYLLELDIFNNSHFHILNYPETTGIMANQLNYGGGYMAVSKWMEKYDVGRLKAQRQISAIIGQRNKLVAEIKEAEGWVKEVDDRIDNFVFYIVDYCFGNNFSIFNA